MSVKEQVKFDLDILKGLLFACIGAIFGIGSYGIINIETLSRKQVILGSAVSIIIAIILAFVLKALAVNRKKLRELEWVLKY